MRSVSCTARGMFAEAWNYHPFGPAWLAAATAGAGVCVLPKRFRERLGASREHHRRLCNTAYTVFVAAFLLHGTLRAMGDFVAVQALFRHS